MSVVVAREPVLETAVMDVLWSQDGWLSSAEVRARLPEERDVAPTTVTTVLTRLWKKRRIERRPRGRAYEYRPTQSREEYAAARMDQMLATAGDRSAALHRFLDQLPAAERRRIRKLLEEL